MLAALGRDPTRVGVLPLASGVALIYLLDTPAGRPAVRWIHLPHAPALTADTGPVETAVVLTASLADAPRVVRLVACLLACLREPATREATRCARTREELVHALAPHEERAAEGSLAAAAVLALLGSGPAGLTDVEATRRRGACGANRLERVRRRSLSMRLLEQFTSFFALLLWVGAVFAFLARLPELGWAILAVIVVNGVFSFFQEFRAERAVEALQDLLPHFITVVRDGHELRVPATDLVPGDVVRLEEGDQIPADGRLLAVEALRVDQSPLTGESHPVFKLPSAGDGLARVPPAERPELVFAGTAVVAGAGTFVVTATGMATQIGGIARLTQAVGEEPSPLQREMARVTRIVTALAVTFGVGFFALGMAAGLLGLDVGFAFGLGVIVANVPEGLLPTLALALALGVQRMARQGSLLKRLSAVETLGATTVICTDKTGTLTENRMAVRWIWTVSGTRAAAEWRDPPADEVRALLTTAVVASQATGEHGDPTEMALVLAAAEAGVDVEKARAAWPLLVPDSFDSFRKRMTLVRAGPHGPTAYVKGAPRETLALCDSLRQDEAAVPLADDLRRAILVEHDRLAREGHRLLAVAARELPATLVGGSAEVVERGLTRLGLVALWDPPRPQVAEAVALCRGAGIRVVMITGDYGLTAEAIARQIGLPVGKVVTGEEVARLSPDALRGLVAEPGVLFARTSPAHKLAIVSRLRELGEVVAVTGDGVNDAPALKAADVGVAMGRRGREVAKEAAVMVITDDNFASIVAAVRQGRPHGADPRPIARARLRARAARVRRVEDSAGLPSGRAARGGGAEVGAATSGCARPRGRPEEAGMIRALIGTLIVMAVGTWALAGAPEHAEQVATGQRLFAERGCFDCHAVRGVGTPIGPDLSRVGLRYRADDMARWLRDPSAQEPTRHMPRIRLTDAEIAALAAYLGTLQ